MIYFQNGDVLIFAENQLPEGLFKLDHGTLAYGEKTGHHHTLYDGDFEQYEDSRTKVRYLRVITPCNLKHQEHKPITIDPGIYRIGIVREMDHFSEEIRRVAD